MSVRKVLRQAGGRVHRFGIPVDPGNLLFHGELGDRPVIGLPGCARSPALNGADWVLERIACGISLTDRDLAELGVGRSSQGDSHAPAAKVFHFWIRSAAAYRCTHTG